MKSSHSDWNIDSYYKHVLHLADLPQQEDRTGDTPLLKLAREISSASLQSKLLQVHLAAAPQFVKNWDHFSARLSSHLLSYLLMAKIPLPTMLEHALRTLKNLRAPELLPQRADLMRLMGMSMWKFTQEDLLADTLLMTKRPILWFDLAWSSSPDFAIASLRNLPQSPAFATAVASRFPYLWKTAGAAAVEAIVDAYSVSDDSIGAQKLKNAMNLLRKRFTVPHRSTERYRQLLNDIRDNLTVSQPLAFQAAA